MEIRYYSKEEEKSNGNTIENALENADSLCSSIN